MSSFLDEELRGQMEELRAKIAATEVLLLACERGGAVGAAAAAEGAAAGAVPGPQPHM